MNYREKIRLYQEGKLSEEEALEVKAWIEKQEAISDYLYDTSEIPELDAIDLTGYDKEHEKQEENARFLALVQKSIRRTLLKMGTVVGIVVLILVLFVQFCLPHVVSEFYYDPEETAGVSPYSGMDTNRMGLDLSVYTELYYPLEHRNEARVEPMGYGTYQVVIPQVISFSGYKPHTVSGVLKRDRILFYDEDAFLTPAVNSFVYPEGVKGSFAYHYEDGEKEGPAGRRKEAKEELSRIPDQEYVKGFVSLNSRVDYKHFAKWIEEKGMDHHNIWCAVYTEGIDGRMISEMTGFEMKGGGLCIDWDRERYPHLSLLDNGSTEEIGLQDEEVMTEHFLSLLQYQMDHPEFAEIMANRGNGISGHITGSETYDKMIRYIEKEGLSTYGFAILATKEELLELWEDPEVSYIFTEAVR